MMIKLGNRGSIPSKGSKRIAGRVREELYVLAERENRNERTHFPSSLMRLHNSKSSACMVHSKWFAF